MNILIVAAISLKGEKYTLIYTANFTFLLLHKILGERKPKKYTKSVKKNPKQIDLLKWLSLAPPSTWTQWFESQHILLIYFSAGDTSQDLIDALLLVLQPQFSNLSFKKITFNNK